MSIPKGVSLTRSCDPQLTAVARTIDPRGSDSICDQSSSVIANLDVESKISSLTRDVNLRLIAAPQQENDQFSLNVNMVNMRLDEGYLLTRVANSRKA